MEMYLYRVLTVLTLVLIIASLASIEYVESDTLHPRPLIDLKLVNKTEIPVYARFVIGNLTSVKDRLTGHRGYYEATKYLYDLLYNLTNGNTILDNYTITIPVDNGSYATVDGVRIKVYPIWPSGGVPVNIECSGKAVVAHSLSDLNGRDLNDSIVFLDIGVDWKWLWVLDPHLGVKAVVFYDSNDAVNARMYDKYLDTPVNLPVGFLPLEELRREYGLTLDDIDGKQVELHLSSTWIEVNVSNIISYIPGRNSNYKIVLLAHYDAWTPAIGYAPGATDALAPAYLVDLVRRYSVEKPEYDTIIALFSGYYEGLVGHRFFVEKYVFEGREIVFRNNSVKLDPKKTIYVGIDINTNSYYIAPASIGYFYTAQAIGITGGALDLYSSFIQTVYGTQALTEKVSQSLGKSFGNAIKQLLLYTQDPNAWWTVFPGPYWLDTEPMWSSGLPAFTLKSAFAEKKYRATPRDTLDNINWTNLAIQFKLLDAYISVLYEKKPGELAQIISKGLSPNAPTRTTTSVRNEMFAKLVGQVMVWVPEQGQRIPLDKAGYKKALVIIRAGSRLSTTSPWNVRITCFTDNKGYFEVTGLHTSRATSLEIIALVLSKNGSVIALNAMGSVSRGTYVSINRPVLGSREAPWEVWIIKYNGTFTVNLVVDPLTYQTPLEGAKISYRVVRSDTLTEPEYYYTALDEIGYFTVYVYRYRNYSIVFNPENIYYVITNAEPGHRYSLYDALKDTLSIVKERLDKLEEFRITNPAAEEFLKRGEQAFNNATRYLSKYMLDNYMAYILVGLTTTYNAYHLTKSTYLDVENTAILFSVLLVFFAFILGLYLRKPGSNVFTVILKTIGITAVIAVIFGLLHPAFYLTVNAVMSIIGFIMIILTIPALLILLSDFNEALRRIKKKVVGIHEVERSRLVTSYVAFSYGVEHMKRRRLRTALTLTTLIVVVISVVLFTSLSSYVEPKPIAITGYTPSRPEGFLFQRESVDRNLPLGVMLYDVVDVVVSNETIPRYWSPGNTLIYLYDKPDVRRTLEGVVATTIYEEELVNISKYIVRGRWFNENDTYVVVLPDSIVNATRGEINVGKTIVLAGVKLRVIGTYDDRRIISVRELDGQTITPVIGFPRARALRIAFIPAKIVQCNPWMGKGVSFMLAQISTVTREDPYRIGRELMYILPSIDTYVYSRSEGLAKYSRLIALHGAGFNYIIAPIVIAGVSILGVMLGTIYERKREIYIYAALGLSPMQIGLMFIAEALAYALIATVIGFTAGIVLTNIATILLPGIFKPNYSSGYVLLALAATFLSVLAASIYPVFKAGRMALPSLRRKWEYPTKPKGDEWTIPLPFKITSLRELLGAYAYMHEYLSGFTSPDIGNFVVEKIGITKTSIENKNALVLEGEVRLKPWHAGIKQLFQVQAIETKPSEWDLVIYLKRQAGNPRTWVKSNKVFIDALRKQLLLWRTLHIEDKKTYMEKAEKLIKY